MNKVKAASALDLVEYALRKRKKDSRLHKYSYYVPSVWASGNGKPRKLTVDPFDFYIDAVRRGKRGRGVAQRKPSGGEWTKDAVIYNMFVRTTTAFDHNGNGKLDLPTNSEGFRETGTFLKSIALLPYIKRMGANTIHLLPITSIGHDGNKGTLGSPYAIRNPYELDENQSEPCLGLDAKTEFKAFVEAAHNFGMRVVVEFVFRTASKDGDWVKSNPEWLYWIDEQVTMRHPGEMDESKYGSPVFTHEELSKIHHDVNAHRFDDLLPPHKTYRDFFTPPPHPDMVSKENGRYIGLLPDGRRVKIPGAFADWPPDDSQPPWGDVTYLRLYEHPEFNYIAYNTIRMYDKRLTHPEYINRPLWDRIVGIIPYYQREFQIDGVMIDMGHALPMELKSEMVKRARTINPDFAFWDENFSISAKSREEGYNAVFGYLWVDQHHPARMKAFCRIAAADGFPIPFFGTPENHNTPRASARPGGVVYAKWSFVVNCFLPTVPFVHSGYELAETYPINTGLDFTPDEIRALPSERLPLFSEYAYDWLNKKQFSDWVASVLLLRSKYRQIIVDSSSESFEVLQVNNDAGLAFVRRSAATKKRVCIVTNSNFYSAENMRVGLDTKKKVCVDLLSRRQFKIKDGSLELSLKPGQAIVFEC